MLKIVGGVALLLLVALLGYRKTFTRLHLPLGARFIYLTGTEFIFVGVALGSTMLGLLDAPTLRSLTPLYSLGLGFIGLIFGLQLEVSKIRRFPGQYFLVTIAQSLVTMGVVFVACLLFLRWANAGAGWSNQVLAALVLAAAAACTGQTTLALMSRELRLRATPFLDLLRYMTGLDAIVGLLAIGIAFALLHTHAPFGAMAGENLLWLALALALGVASGFLAWQLVSYRCSEEELLLFITGMILFAGGLAQFFKLSPLFICMIMGIVLANLRGPHQRISVVLGRLEHPFYVVLLILAGATWSPPPSWVWILAAVYLVVRAASKVTGTWLGTRFTRSLVPTPVGTGWGLLSQGGIAVAIALNYCQQFPGELACVVMTAVLSAVVINELLSPALIRGVLTRSGATEEKRA